MDHAGMFTFKLMTKKKKVVGVEVQSNYSEPKNPQEKEKIQMQAYI